MDFFIKYSYIICETLVQFGALSATWVIWAIGGLIFAVLFGLRSVGLFTIAKREGYKNSWMSFVPFLNTYYIGVCGRKNRFFNVDTRIVAIVVTVFEVVITALLALYLAAIFSVQPYVTLTTSQEVYFGEIYPMPSVSLNVTNMLLQNPDLAWAGWCYNYLDGYIISMLMLLYSLGQIILLNCFFQTYSPRYYFVFTLISVFIPLQSIFIFIVRKHRAVSYAEYTRMIQERMYRQYRSQQNFNSNPYNQNPYSSGYGNPAGQQAQQSAEPEAPFSEFGTSSKGSEPFDEFKN